MGFHTNKINAQQEAGLFDLVEAHIDALDKVEYEIAAVPDSPYRNRGRIFANLGVALDDPKVANKANNVALLLTHLIKSQIPEEDRYTGNSEVECSLTTYQGKACFYLVLPEHISIDPEKLRERLQEVKALIKETEPPLLDARSHRARARYFWQGGFDEAHFHEAVGVMSNLQQFHSQRLNEVHRIGPNSHGESFLRYLRSDINELFRKEPALASDVRTH